MSQRAAEADAGREPAAGRRRSLALRGVLLLGLLAALICLQGSQREPTGPAAGTSFVAVARVADPQGSTLPTAPANTNAPDQANLSVQANAPAQEEPRPLRIGLFNIRGGKGLDERRDLERIAATLAHAGPLDLIGLNEVHGCGPWDQRNQAQLLGEQLAMPWLFVPTERRWWHEHFGNGMLATLPVRSWQRIGLPRSEGKSSRNLLLAEVEHDGAPLRVLLTHVDRASEVDRLEQLRTVLALFAAIDEPAVLIGDLNSTADDPQMQALLATPGIVDALDLVPPAPGITPKRWQQMREQRIDWILAKGLRATSAGRLDSGSSDHPYYWATLVVER